MSTSVNDGEPEVFREAVESLSRLEVRPEISVGPIRPPQRLAPYSHALGVEILPPRGDDVPEGKLTSFPMAVKRKDDETVVFSWITWPDRQTRDSGMEKSMADPRLKDGMDQCPFDGQRMIFGGFQVIVDA